jgi:thiol:disulfide interchange protein
MANKYKAIIIVLIGAAVLGALFLPGLDQILQSDEVGQGNEDADEVALETFSPTSDSFMEYTQARAAGKPILLEFYARW